MLIGGAVGYTVGASALINGPRSQLFVSKSALPARQPLPGSGPPACGGRLLIGHIFLGFSVLAFAVCVQVTNNKYLPPCLSRGASCHCRGEHGGDGEGR
jgi:hypothetical protein